MERKNIDYTLFFLLVAIVVFGLVMLASASTALGEARFGDELFYVKRQILFGAIPGIIGMIALSKIKYTFFQKHATLIYGLIVLLLIAVFIPGIGATNNTTAKSWLSLGPINVQPSEVAKFGIIVFMSAYIAKRNEFLEDLQSGLIPAFVLGGITILLVILQPDIGTVAIMFSILFGLLLMAKTRIKHMATVAVLGLVALGLMIVAAPYRAARLTIFLHPELDPQGIGYQTSQSLLAVGTGGWFGLGLGRSRQKFQYLPEVHADSIFAVISEELGFVIVTAYVLTLLFLIHRLLRISKYAEDTFARFFVFGIVLWISAQSILNIGAIIGLMPLTGVPLPFISHGGTALAILLSSFGVVLNISKYGRKR